MTFEEMFSAIHGYAPFPWQSEAARLLVAGEPISAVNVPTASGKTAMIDAALYAVAHGGPRRIAFVIDRRVVVDEAYDRTQRINEALKTEDSLADFATRLGSIQVVRLRGGVHGDDDWVLYPDKVTVIISTVDQVGSRLLHRGYGVSSRMAPVHAGFIGNEALYIVDEAHLSIPFVETVNSARRYGADVRLITMTATPVAEADGTVDLSAEDRAHPILIKRLKARKLARLVNSSDKEAQFVKDAVSEAQTLAESARVIGIVVNRVNTARRIRQTLAKLKFNAELLTGRIRPYDRDRLMKRLFPDIRAGRVRGEGAPVFLVATQTIEVGADIDFDALITEAASLDALRQRFGRLDRLGELGNTQGAILYRSDLDKKGKIQPDPIYGMTIHSTWKWLQKVSAKGCVDFGIDAMEKQMKRVEAPKTELKQAPALLPAHIGLLAQTGPEAPYIDVSPWLHGAQSGSADVSLVWRADLYPDNHHQWVETVRLRPPLGREALEMPIYAVRAWLQGLREQEVTDLEGIGQFVFARRESGKPILLWRGSDDCEVVYPNDIRPGDTVILPTDYGGCDEYGWAPKSEALVKDIADFCSLERQKDHVVRLVTGLTGWLGDAEKTAKEAVLEVVASETEVDPVLGIDQNRVKNAHAELRRIIADIQHPLVEVFRGRFEIERHPKGVVLRGRIIDEVNASLYSGVAIELDLHLKGVARLADGLAHEHPEQERIVRAAWRHDLGKADPHFQNMLHGNSLAAAAGPLLAKSGLRKLSQMLAAYAESGLPKGFRHELASLSPSLPQGELESDILVRYLIATHHGYGRPWFPPCAYIDDTVANMARLGSGWVQAFAALVERYGPWFLAGMELLLRASDARQSRIEREEGNA